MNAHTVVVGMAWSLMSALVLLVVGYAAFAPALSRINGARFDAESGPLAEAEAARWKAFKSTGEWPDEVPASKRVDRIAAKVRQPLHRLKTGKDKAGADQ